MTDRSQIRFICDSVTYGSAKAPALMLVGHFFSDLVLIAGLESVGDPVSANRSEAVSKVPSKGPNEILASVVHLPLVVSSDQRNL